MTTIRLAHRTVAGVVRTMFVEHQVPKEGKDTPERWAPLTLHKIFDEAALRAYHAEMGAALEQPILEIDAMEMGG